MPPNLLLRHWSLYLMRRHRCYQYRLMLPLFKKLGLPLFYLLLGGSLTLAGQNLAKKLMAKPIVTSNAIGFEAILGQIAAPALEFATKTSKGNHFIARAYTSRGDLVAALESGKIDAAYIDLIEALKLRERGIKIKVVLYGQRNGAGIVVRKDSKAKSLADLKGLRIAVPSRVSTEYLVLMEKLGDLRVWEKDISLLELPSQNMPTALEQKKIDAFFGEEPFASVAARSGVGKILAYTHDFWPDFISNVLVLRDDFAEAKPELAQELVMQLHDVSEWIDLNRALEAPRLKPYFPLLPEEILYALTKEWANISFRNLTPTQNQVRGFQDLAIRYGVMDRALAMDQVLDLGFLPQ